MVEVEIVEIVGIIEAVEVEELYLTEEEFEENLEECLSIKTYPKFPNDCFVCEYVHDGTIVNVYVSQISDPFFFSKLGK